MCNWACSMTVLDCRLAWHLYMSLSCQQIPTLTQDVMPQWTLANVTALSGHLVGALTCMESTSQSLIAFTCYSMGCAVHSGPRIAVRLCSARTCHFHLIYNKKSTCDLCVWSCPSLFSPLMITVPSSSFIHTHFSFFGFSAVSTVISCTCAGIVWSGREAFLIDDASTGARFEM